MNEAAMNWLIRPLQRSDADAVVRLIGQCYGQTYIKEYYDPGYINRLNDEGILMSIVAIAENGEVAGHTALARKPDSTIAEVAMSLVAPQYRGNGVFSHLVCYIHTIRETLRQRCVMGICIRSVVHHPYAQRAAGKQGFRDCGLLLANYQIVSFEGFPPAPAQRTTTLLAYLETGAEKQSPVYPPNRHREMIDRLLGNIGLNAEKLIPDMPEEALTGTAPPLIHFHVGKNTGYADIYILSYGAGVVAEVEERLSAFWSQGVEAVFLYLDMRDPLTYYLAPEFKKIGFFFAGILPQTITGTALILQYLRNVKLIYEAFHVASKTGRELLSYIEAMHKS